MAAGQHATGEKGGILRSFVSLLIMIAFVLGLSWALRTYVFTAYEIPSGSMEETIMPGDMVFAEKVSYYFRDPQPGDSNRNLHQQQAHAAAYQFKHRLPIHRPIRVHLGDGR